MTDGLFRLRGFAVPGQAHGDGRPLSAPRLRRRPLLVPMEPDAALAAVADLPQSNRPELLNALLE